MHTVHTSASGSCITCCTCSNYTCTQQLKALTHGIYANCHISFCVRVTYVYAVSMAGARVPFTCHVHCAIIYCRQAGLVAKTLAARERYCDFVTFLRIPQKSGRLVLFIALIPCVNGTMLCTCTCILLCMPSCYTHIHTPLSGPKCVEALKKQGV